LKPEYNICTTAGSTLGKLHSDKTKAKIAEARIGLKHSQETKAKLAEARIGLKHSQETKSKISDAMPTSIKIEVTDITNNTTTYYDSISEAARALNINKAIIAMYFSRNQQKPYKGIYTFVRSRQKVNK